MTMSSSSASRGFRPPQINLGTWIDRPKSEISLKQDSDYRIGVGQLQARATPVVRQAEPKPPKENLNLISSNDAVSRSNSWRVTQQPPYKSSVTINSLATEQVSFETNLGLFGLGRDFRYDSREFNNMFLCPDIIYCSSLELEFYS
jgi:hypothetical protein